MIRWVISDREIVGHEPARSRINSDGLLSYDIARWQSLGPLASLEATRSSRRFPFQPATVWLSKIRRDRMGNHTLSIKQVSPRFQVFSDYGFLLSHIERWPPDGVLFLPELTAEWVIFGPR